MKLTPKRKLLFCLIFISTLLGFFYYKAIVKNNFDFIDCPPEVFYDLKNILMEEKNLKTKSGRRIFLIETHMDKERFLTNPRQACTVESAALMSPDYEVYFLFATKFDEVNLKISELVEALLAYPNIHIRYINPNEFSKETKLENFFQRGALDNSSFPIENMANVMRVLILNKYGGQYLDLDIISLVPLSVVNQKNFACTETETLITNAIMNLDNDEFGGKPISDKYLELLDESYNPKVWGANGPVMFYNAVANSCNGTKFSTKNETKCGNFSVLPNSKCYPIMYGEWKKIFEDEHKDYILKKLNDTGAYFLHVWNKMQDFDQKHFKLKFDSKSAYIELAKSYCPKVYETLVKYF